MVTLVEQDRSRTRFLYAVLGVAGVIEIGYLVSHFVLHPGQIVNIWQLPEYWLYYSDGFVRRGLPGQVVRILSGGAPSLFLVQLVGVLLSLAAIAALAYLCVRVARMAPTPLARTVLLTVLLISPLTVSLVVRDIGRYDGVGMIVSAGVALLPWSARARQHPWAVLTVCGLAITVAVATEEFLLAVLAPIPLLAAWRSGIVAGRAALVRAAALTVGPGAVVAGASLLITPSDTQISDTLAAATRAGADFTRPLNAVSVLAFDVGKEISLASGYGAAAILVSVGFFAAFFGVTAWALWALLGGPDRRVFLLLAGYYLVVDLALCVVGFDYRRWAALAFIGLLACAAALRPESVRSAPPSTLPAGRTWWVVVVLLVVSLPAMLSTIIPGGDLPQIDSAPVQTGAVFPAGPGG